MLNKYFKNDEDAKTVASGIEEMVNQRFQTEKERLATKMDIMELKGRHLARQGKDEAIIQGPA